MKIALLYGKWASQIHGPFDIDGLYKTQALTGSESSFFNTVKGLAELGHEAVAYCDIQGAHFVSVPYLMGASVRDIGQCNPEFWQKIPFPAFDAVIAWNEPDLLRGIPANVLRLCAQQLNDFSYCQPGYAEAMDAIVCPSHTHAAYLKQVSEIPHEKFLVIPNSTNLEFFTDMPRRPQSIAWCSSPDRGLHHLLWLWPYIRIQMPEATLRIYYRVHSWYQAVKDVNSPSGQRARYIFECLRRLGQHGENGVHLVDAIGNQAMCQELSQTMVLGYPCHPIRFTEGFGVSVLDALAAGCVPVISKADAFPELYRHSGAFLVEGDNPASNQEAWLNALIGFMKPTEDQKARRESCQLFARRFSRERVSKEWDETLLRLVRKKYT